VLVLVEDAGRKPTLIGERMAGKAEYRWDIRMQGEGETVFFDC
jgi:protocatechuate 3,4-dioxygenase alpha subunit